MNGGINISTKYELTLNKNYVSKWTVQDAIREFIQNAKDQETVIEDNAMSINYNEQEEKLFISNKNSILSVSSLLLGTTTKENDNKTIGQFGEGYKIALLVLNRLNKEVIIYNYGKREVWTSAIVYSKKYKDELLTIYIDKKHIWQKVPDNNLTIEINNITKEEFEELKNRTLLFNDNIKEKNTSYGRILFDEEFKGKIFVNSLYITMIPKLQYGYDIKPEYINIGRDRDLVSSYDIQNITSNMWSENPGKELERIITEQVYDVEYLYRSMYNDNNNLLTIADNLYDKYKGKKRNIIKAVINEDEAKEIRLSYTGVTPIFVDYNQKEILENSPKYKKNLKKIKKSNKKDITINQAYKIWKTKYSYSLSKTAIRELDKIIRNYENRLKEYNI